MFAAVEPKNISQPFSYSGGYYMQMKLKLTVAAAIAAAGGHGGRAGRPGRQDRPRRPRCPAPQAALWQGQRERRAHGHRGPERAEHRRSAARRSSSRSLAEDDAADPKQGTAAAQKLCDAKVAGVVGHLNSGTTIPASKVYNDCGIPHVTASATNPNLTKPGYKTTFRIIANDNALGAGLALLRRRQAEAQEGRRSSTTAPPTARASPKCSRRPPVARA